MPLEDHPHLGKLQGQFIPLGTCNAVVNLGKGIVQLINDTTAEKDQPLLTNALTCPHNHLRV